METEQFEKFEQKIFSGYLSSDVECKYNNNGLCTSKFTIPLKENKDDEPVWLNCIVFGELAENIAEKFNKGSKITVIGRFKVNTYNNKEYLSFVTNFAF